MATATPPDTEAQDQVIAEHTAAIESALATRAARKEELRRQIREADAEFAAVIKAARQDKVPWRDINKAAGMSRQMTNELLREHT